MGPDPTFGNIPLDQILAAAGVTLNPPADNGPLAYATPQEAYQDPSAIDPNATALPDQANQAGGFYPGQPENAVPVDNSSAPMYPAAPGESYTTSQSGTRQEASRGFSPEKYAQVDAVAKAPGGIDQQLSRLSQKGDQYINAYGQQQEVSAQAGRDAIAANTEAERAKILAQGRDSARLAAMNQANAIEESKQTALAAQRTHEYMTKYEESLQAIRGVDPRQLWDSLGSGGQIGMLGAAFAQGMFALKGVNLGVMDNWNRAVDRSINAQIENIKKGLDVADGFRKLWDMSRADSATDTEARLRVRGYMLQSFQDQVASEMAGYDSKLAAAKGQAGLAQIETELTKNKGELAQIANAKFNAEAQNATHIFATKTAAATAYQEHLDRQAALNAKGAKGVTPDLVLKVNALAVPDPETGKNLGMGHTEEEANRLRKEATEKYGAVQEVLDYEHAVEAVKSRYNGPLAGQLNNSDVADLETKRMLAITSLEKARAGTRGASSPGIMDRYEKMLQNDTWTNRDGYDKAVRTATDVAASIRRDIRSSLAGMRAPADWESSLLTEGVPNSDYAPATGAEIGSLKESRGHPAPPTRVASLVGDIQKTFKDSPTAHDPNDTTASLYGAFLQLHPEYKPAGWDAQQSLGRPVPVPTWAEKELAVAEAYDPSLGPSYFPGKMQKSLHTPAEQAEGLQALQTLASGGVPAAKGVDPMTADQMLFAQYLLDEVLGSHKANQEERVRKAQRDVNVTFGSGGGDVQ